MSRNTSEREPNREQQREPERERQREPTEDGEINIGQQPPRLAISTAVTAAVVAALAATAGDPIGGVVTFLGVAMLGIGLSLGSRQVVVWGIGVCSLGLLIAGTLSTSPGPTLIGAAALLFAWEVARHGLSIGSQVGTDAVATRSLTATAGLHLAVISSAGAVIYATFTLSAGGRHISAVVLLLLGATVLATASQ